MNAGAHFHTRGSWIGKKLSALPDKIAQDARNARSRPTIKAFPYATGHKDHQQVVSFEIARLRIQAHRVFTTVGGEVESGEGWILALDREFREELMVPCVHLKNLKEASILAMQTVATQRDEWRSKLVVVVGVPVQNFHPGNFLPKKTELQNPCIGTICQTVAHLRQCRNTPDEMEKLYQSALSELRLQIAGKWRSV